jgi:hypothetical protein
VVSPSLTGAVPGTVGSTNLIHVHRIGEEDVELYADRTRSLPVVDPDDRELIISCGAALCHLKIALLHFGYFGDIKLLPDLKQPTLLARITLGFQAERATADSLLFQAIQKRRTNRLPFSDDPEKTIQDALAYLTRREWCQRGTWLVIITNALASGKVIDALTLDVLEHQVRLATRCNTGVEELRDVGMMQLGENIAFLPQALLGGFADQRGAQHLDGDVTFVLPVSAPRAPDAAHSAPADLGFNDIGSEARARSQGQFVWIIRAGRESEVDRSSGADRQAGGQHARNTSFPNARIHDRRSSELNELEPLKTGGVSERPTVVPSPSDTPWRGMD